MPELPDVEVFRRHVAATSLHREIERTHVSDRRVLEKTSPQALARRLKGRQFESTQRRGKYLLLQTDDEVLVLHFGMTGRPVFVAESDELPKFTRVEFTFTDGDRLAYVCRRMLGRISLATDEEELADNKQLGPDALEIEAQEFRERLSQKRGTVKSALMDQSTVAGIGNVYSDEVLFQMHLHPQTKMEDLEKKEIKKLPQVAQRVIKTAIRHHANPKEMPRSYLLGHRDGDGQCPRCGRELEKVSVSGRNAIYCPSCQA